MKHHLPLILSAALLAAITMAAPSPAATLVREGRPAAIVALPQEPNAFESLAARELIEHVEKMSGAKLETATVDAGGVDDFLAQARHDGRAAVLLGRNVASRLEKLLAGTGSVPGAFALTATDDHVMIAGSEEG
ncbi:MAG: hypothetical protein M3463_06720, partial [Verrucomicrobiota bacterium]|nr:hypothetical protein [Verrucomicrobiota bacterium]